MLRSTFLHLSGVGPWTETQIWRLGIRDWNEFRRRPDLPGVSAARKTRWDFELDRAEAALGDRAADWFARRLPTAEHWRLYPEFRAETAYLDIETTSLSPYQGMVTVVAVHAGGRTRSFVAGDNLEELPAYLGRFRVLVTFNGVFFDVPFLRVAFPEWTPPAAHIDLRFVLRRLGYAGGLKRIEQELGLGDRTGVEGIRGLDAVRLWHEWRSGRRESLDLLVEYNRADTANLEPLLEFSSTEMGRRLAPARPGPSLESYGAPDGSPGEPGRSGPAPSRSSTK